MLKKPTYIILAILLCIPLIIAIVLSFSINTEKPSTELLVEITVENAHGNKFAYRENEVFELYANAVGNAMKTSSPNRDLAAETPSVVTHVEKDSNYSYSYYMSKDFENCYFSNTKGEFYRLDPEDAKLLLDKDEFVYVYENYAFPEVILSVDGKDRTVFATEDSEWFFTRGDVLAEGVRSDDAAETGSIAVNGDSSFGAEFSTLPDRCSVVVFNKSQQVHYAEWESFTDTDDIGNKLFGDLGSKLNFTSDTKLVCEISAEWLKTDGSTYYGTVAYTSEFFYDVPASADSTPVDKSLPWGGFTFVKLHNVNEGETLRLVPENPDFVIPETKIHKIGDMTFCYLPVALGTPTGAHTLNLMSGDTLLDTVSFTVSSKSFGDDNPAKVTNFSSVSGTLDNAKKDFEKLIVSVCDSSRESHLWQDAKTGTSGNKYMFAKPVAGNVTPSTAYSYGKLVGDDPNLVQSLPYRRTGLFFETEQGKNVNATASGIVAAAGENAYAGKYVIIDHGFGMVSVYENLSEITVANGDNVVIGTPVGKTGKSAYVGINDSTSRSGLRFSMVIDGVYINPVSNYNYGVSY